jgi:preprotein translocase subunit SecA
MEDDLMVKFGSERIKSIMDTLGLPEDQAISNKMISRNIESSQKRVEGFNFDRRKGLLDFDNVISKQREIIYERRNEILDKDSITDRVMQTFREYVENVVNSHRSEKGELNSNDLDNIMEHFNSNLLKSKKIKLDEIKDKSPEEIIDYIYDIVVEDYNNKLKDVPEEIQDDFEKAITLRVIDKHWMDQLDAMENLKEGVGLRGYAQTNPLQVYALEGFQLFDDMLAAINAEVTTFLLKAEVRQNLERVEHKNIHTNDGKEKAKNAPKKASPKIGRNDPCPCGSGKKYKQCCGK